jgi:hypothetical protein
MSEAERITIQTAMLPATKKFTMEEGKLETPDITLEAITHTVGFGNGDSRIKTKAFEIRVPLEIRLTIKEILTRIATKDDIPDGPYIPYGLIQTVGAKVYKKCSACKTTSAPTSG